MQSVLYSPDSHVSPLVGLGDKGAVLLRLTSLMSHSGADLGWPFVLPVSLY